MTITIALVLVPFAFLTGCGDDSAGNDVVDAAGDADIVEDVADDVAVDEGAAEDADAAEEADAEAGEEDGESDSDTDAVECVDVPAVPTGISTCFPECEESGFTFCNNPAVADCGVDPGCTIDMDVDGVVGTPDPTDYVDLPDSVSVTVTFSGIDEAIPVDMPLLGQCDQLRWLSDGLHVFLEITFDALATPGVVWMTLSNAVSFAEGSRFESSAEIGDTDYASCGSAEVSADAMWQAFFERFLIAEAEKIIEQTLCLGCEGGCPEGTTCIGDPPACRFDDSLSCVTYPLACWPIL